MTNLGCVDQHARSKSLWVLAKTPEKKSTKNWGHDLGTLETFGRGKRKSPKRMMLSRKTDSEMGKTKINLQKGIRLQLAARLTQLAVRRKSGSVFFLPQRADGHARGKKKLALSSGRCQPQAPKGRGRGKDGPK